MKPRVLLNKLLAKSGYEIVRRENDAYDEDGLKTRHAHPFTGEGGFLEAYARGVQAAGSDYGWRWRVHVGLWAALHASKLSGDFVECGVNRGALSSAIMRHLDWNTIGITFWLLDTFAGIDPRFISDSEREAGVMEGSRAMLDSGFYVDQVESVRSNFSEWRNVRIIKGAVPDTLSQVDAKAVSYLHLDMNCAPPEAAAAEFFWNRLAEGGVILLDDYGFPGHRAQLEAMDAFASSKKTKVLALPTGQGIIFKTPAR